jgi:hypothetical protein
VGHLTDNLRGNWEENKQMILSKTERHEIFTSTIFSCLAATSMVCLYRELFLYWQFYQPACPWGKFLKETATSASPIVKLLTRNRASQISTKKLNRLLQFVMLNFSAQN